MKKKYNLKIYLKFTLIISLLLLPFCTKNSSNPSNDQSAIIFVDKSFRPIDGEFSLNFNPDAINIYGSITSNELPEINYIKLGETLATNLFEYQYKMGEISFKNNSEIMVTKNTFGIEIESTQGIIEGEIALPSLLSNVNFSIQDSLKKGDSLIVSWDNSNTDFYLVEGNYFYIDLENRISSINLDTLIESSSLVFESNTLNYDGDLFIFIYPVNGAFPQKGAIANMQGGGFLYSVNRGSINLIKVGNGLVLPPPIQKRNLYEDQKFDIKKLISSKLNGR